MTGARWEQLRAHWRAWRANQRLQRMLTVGVLFLTLGFMLVLLWRERAQLQQFDDWRNYLSACALSLALYPCSLIIHTAVWSQMMARLGQIPQSWQDVEIYVYTHVMRHLPGAVWYLATRSVMYQGQGVHPAVTLVASGLEWVWLILGGGLIYVVLALPPVAGVGVMLGVSILLLVVGRWSPKLLEVLQEIEHLPTWLQRWQARLFAVNLPTTGDLFLWLGGYLVTYGIAGVIFFILVRSVVPDAGVTLAEALRVWALTSGVGMLVVGLVPAGLGVQELTITALLPGHVPVVAALFIAALVRVVFIVGDFFWAPFLWICARYLSKRAARRGTGMANPR